MNTKFLAMSIALSLPIIAAETESHEVFSGWEDEKGDGETKVSKSKIVNHGVQVFSQTDELIKKWYPDSAIHQRVTDEVKGYFKNTLTASVGVGSVGTAIMGKDRPHVLFFNNNGTAFVELKYDSQALPLLCAINEKITFTGDRIPHVAVLYDNGDLVQFIRETTLGIPRSLWLKKKITNITDEYQHADESKPSALEDNPAAIEYLMTFDEGECMCYSSNKMFVISEDGQELCRSIMPDQWSITDVVSTFPALKKIALCTMQTLTSLIEEQPELHAWTRATKLERWRDSRNTGKWKWDKIDQRPTYLDFNNNNELIFDPADQTHQ